MTDATPEKNEVETLRNHNAELLSDLKKSRSKISELTEQLASTTSEKEAALIECRRLKLEEPVGKLLEDISAHPKYLAMELEAVGYTFDLDGDEVVIRDKEGERATLGEVSYSSRGGDDKAGSVKMREAAFTSSDLEKLALGAWLPEQERAARREKFEKILIGSKATGGGLTGSNFSSGRSATDNTQKPQVERLPTGLR